MSKQEKPLSSDATVTELQENAEAEQKLASKTAGELLRAAREEQNIDKEMLASTLKVSMRQLELLEDDRYDALPDMAFTRNFAISVAKRLKVDEKLIAELLPKMDNLAMVHAVVKFSSDGSGSALKNEVLTRKKRSGKWGLLLLALLVMLVALIFLLPQWGDKSAQGENSQDGATENRSVQVMTTPTSRTQNTSVTVPSLQNSSANVLVATNPPSTTSRTISVTEGVQGGMQVTAPVELAIDAQGEQMQAEASTDVAAVTQVATTEASSVQSLPETLEIKTKTQSWVIVRNRAGKELYNAMLTADAPISFPLEGAPLSVRVGAPTEAEVKVRGSLFDIKPHIADQGVANFKVE